MLAGERSLDSSKRFPFYTEKFYVRDFSVSLVSFGSSFSSARCGCCGVGVSVSERLGSARDCSGAFGSLLSFEVAKDMLGAPRRNVLRAGRSSSGCSARNDALLGCNFLCVTIFFIRSATVLFGI